MFEKLRDWCKGYNVKSIGNEANSILHSEAYQVAKESLQEELLQEFVSSSPDDKEKREQIYRSYVLIEHMTQELAKLYDRAEKEPTE